MLTMYEEEEDDDGLLLQGRHCQRRDNAAMAAAATATSPASMMAGAQLASPTGRATVGRTRSAAARAIASSSSTSSHFPAQPQERTLLGALASFAGPSTGRLWPGASSGTSTDLEAQRTSSTTLPKVDVPSPFAIGDDDDGHAARANERRPHGADTMVTEWPSGRASSSRLRSKMSDSSSEHDHIGSRLGRAYGDGVEEDDDEAAQYASMVEPGGEHATLLQLKPMPSPARASLQVHRYPDDDQAFKPAIGGGDAGGQASDRTGLLKDSTLDEDDDELDEGLARRGPIRHDDLDTAQTSAFFAPNSSAPLLFDPATASVAPGVVPASGSVAIEIPFEPMSRGEKTWMWLVSALVSVLIVVALLISEDVIDWPGDGIGKD